MPVPCLNTGKLSDIATNLRKLKKKTGHDPGDLLSLLSLWLESLLPTNLHFDHTPTVAQIFEFSNSFSGFSEALAA